MKWTQTAPKVRTHTAVESHRCIAEWYCSCDQPRTRRHTSLVLLMFYTSEKHHIMVDPYSYLLTQYYDNNNLTNYISKLLCINEIQ